MSFIDTNIFVAALNKRDKHHVEGKSLLEKAFMVFEWLYASDYVLDECLSVTWARTKDINFTERLNFIRQLDKFIQGSEKIELLKVDEPSFSAAKSYLRKFPTIIPTLTDWTSLVLMQDYKIFKILSFDKNFDKAKSILEFSKIIRISNATQLE